MVNITSIEVDFAAAVAKPPSQLQEQLAEWIIDKCGLEFSSKPAEKGFREGVRLATVLRMAYQVSPENAARRMGILERNQAKALTAAEKREARLAKQREARLAKQREVAEAPAKPKAVRKAKLAAPEVETAEEIVAPVSKPRGRPRKAAPVTEETPAAAPRKRGRPAKVQTANVTVDVEYSDVPASAEEAPVAPPKRRGRPAKATLSVVPDEPATEKKVTPRRRRPAASAVTETPAFTGGASRPKPRTAPNPQEAPF